VFSNGPMTKSREAIDRRPAGLGDDAAAEGHHHGGPVTLRVGMAQRTDKRPPVTDDRVGHQRRRRCHGRLPGREDVGALELRVPCECADPDRPISIDPVVVQARDAVDVDEQLGRGEAQLEQRDQTLPAGQHLGLPAAIV
jgi:hypothetical protein